jgi:TonB family protein
MDTLSVMVFLLVSKWAGWLPPQKVAQAANAPATATPPVAAKPSSSLTNPEDEFLPQNKRHLRGRQLSEDDFRAINAALAAAAEKPDAEVTTDVDLRTSVIGELQKLKSDGIATLAKSGISASFKEVISQVPVEGRFEILMLNSPLSDGYVRNLERTIRANIFPPIIARTMSQTATVVVTFVVKRDGSITQIQKETSSGSSALDATAIGACRSSSPLPPPTNATAEEVVRMRLVLTFNP